MTLENKKLDAQYSEMNALLSERQGELARDTSGEHKDDKAQCDTLAGDVAAWKDKAEDVPAQPDDPSRVAKLEDEARDIISRIAALGRG